LSNIPVAQHWVSFYIPFNLALTFYIGNKLYTHTKDSINRRDTGVKALINAFNRQVDTMKQLQISIPRYRLLPIPRKLDAKKIFQIDVFSTLWEDNGLLSNDDGEQRWRTDEKTRVGIQHLLELDRCKEEEERLKWEVSQLAKWAMERAESLTDILARLGTYPPQSAHVSWLGASLSSLLR
jgi:hypothetical protein